MAYTSSGRLPIERASKINHVKIIQEPHIQRLLEALEHTGPHDTEMLGERSGTLDLTQVGELENIVAIDGSHVAIPDAIYQYKRIAFITAGAVVLRRSEIAAMKASPIIDPRDRSEQMQKRTMVKVTAIPLSGVSIPGETLVNSIRTAIDDTLRSNDLYSILRFLIYRQWLPHYDVQEHMVCINPQCDETIHLPRGMLRFSCSHCGMRHTLADYLSLVQGSPDDWATEEVASNLRNVMETLLMMRLLKWAAEQPFVLRRTLFVKDGPLLLRAQLYRLNDAIKEYLSYLKEQGQTPHIVGVEKTGDLVAHLPLLAPVLCEVGDYFLPSIRYLHERIRGVPFVEKDYRNRVQYGAKVIVRLGPHHVIVFNVPTGEFITEPEVEDLYGFESSMALLSEMLSSAHENALIPLVLANQAASIAPNPSADILETFANRLLGSAHG